MSTLDIDLPAYTVLSTRHMRAAKPYRCWACGQGILPGQRYTRITYIYEGTLHTDRMHNFECYHEREEI